MFFLKVSFSQNNNLPNFKNYEVETLILPEMFEKFKDSVSIYRSDLFTINNDIGKWIGNGVVLEKYLANQFLDNDYINKWEESNQNKEEKIFNNRSDYLKALYGPDLNPKVVLLNEVSLSVHYTSYLILITRDNRYFRMRNLFLINTNFREIKSICEIANYYATSESSRHSYSLHKGKGNFIYIDNEEIWSTSYIHILNEPVPKKAIQKGFYEILDSGFMKML